jgi:hypothetical protein
MATGALPAVALAQTCCAAPAPALVVVVVVLLLLPMLLRHPSAAEVASTAASAHEPSTPWGSGADAVSVVGVEAWGAG